ncbi:hypothetical protein SAMN04488028_106195 [Reichenbachiella agariperforans]|uniref:Uncharacterized protein n=1 Tax=Reichenbachiella agariperforans TaxID=156994 RepID=A0A1M6TUW5_REIAG|nr:hypothetical protein [Reichenbachiella agariperforans]SHK60792.1 hypothetical protein SAMN04488028_106195 [Reichenbachiella agariperforans]
MHGSKLNPQAKHSFIHDYSQLILDDFFGQNEAISGQQIISLTSIKQVNFFILKVLFEEWQEETKKFKSPYFNYQNEEVSHALHTLVNTLSKHIHIQKEDLRPLLERAVTETIDYLYTPSDYLLQEATKLNSTDLIQELKNLGKYIKLYKDLYDAIIQNLEKGMSTDAPVLKSVIKNGVENYALNQEEQQEIEILFNTVTPFDLLEKETPVEPVASEPETAEEVNFFDTLEELPEEPVHVSPEPIEPEPQKEELITAPEERPSPIYEEDSMVEEFEPEVAPTTFEPETPVEEKPKKKGTSSKPNLNEQFAPQDIRTLHQRYEESGEQATIASSHESKPTPELVSSISINQRYLFIKDLFEGNEKDYEKALYQMETSKSFDASVELLVQSYAKKYAWDMNSDEVKELLKVIFKRFR